MDEPPKSPVQLAAAESLVAEYAEVAQSVTDMLATGVPDTLLPASRDEIRRAFGVVVRHHAAAGCSAGSMNLYSLRNSYLSLASFLPYDEANAAIRLETAFARGDRAYLSTPAAQQAIMRSRQIEQDATVLANEFDGLLRTHESDELLLEIDTLLAELDRKFISTSNG
jgi:hypothetical protein